MSEYHNYQRGNIYIATLEPHVGSEQGGTRPVLLLQNDIGNSHSPTLIVAPLTSKIQKKRHQPTHCILEGLPFLDGSSLVLLEQITTIDKQRIVQHLGQITDGQMANIENAIRVSLALEQHE